MNTPADQGSSEHQHGGSDQPGSDQPFVGTIVADGEALAVGFVQLLRTAGLAVSASSTINFTEALGLIELGDRESVYWCGRATLLHHPEDIPLYDNAFRIFFEQRPIDWLGTEGAAPPPTTIVVDSDDEPERDDGDEGEEPPGEIETVRFSRVEVLSTKDFGDCTDEELNELTHLMAQLKFTTFRRLSRRQVPVKRRGGRPDLGRTVRWALKHQGEPVRRAFTKDASRPRRLVLILDVSGSMESYARALIRFVHAAVVARGRVEVFTFGTRLTRITRQLNNRDPDAAIDAVAPEVRDWAGGTRIGEALRQFNDEWGVRGLARGGVVVILSDGWDRGEAEELAEQMERLHRVTHELIWVNPLKASPGYAPLAAGMAAALPHVDTFVSGNTYRSLEVLASILAGTHSRSR